jgi:uncharacterized protein YcgL (UPF0745 family)
MGDFRPFCNVYKTIHKQAKKVALSAQKGLKRMPDLLIANAGIPTNFRLA